jgi:hypothetical protein
MNYRGNRFNTIFHNAAGTFYIAKHLINYLTNSKSTLSYTQNFILTTLKNDYVILEPDKVSQSLFEKSSLDDMTQSVLQQLCTVIKDKSKQLFKDFLENGKFCNPSETLAKKSESCPPNNISVERVFGELDTKIKQAPNCNISNIEACLNVQK